MYRVEFETGCEQVIDLLAFCYSGLVVFDCVEFKRLQTRRSGGGGTRSVLRYRISRDAFERDAEGSPYAAYQVELPSEETQVAFDEGALLFLVEKDLTTRCQQIHSEVLYLHAASLARTRARSTPRWRPGSWQVDTVLCPADRWRFPVSERRAGSGRARHAAGPSLSAGTLAQEPASRRPGSCRPRVARAVAEFTSPVRPSVQRPRSRPSRSGTLFLLEPGVTERRHPSLWPISEGEATARLFANVLNPKGHPSDGLDAVLAIVRGASCYALQPADLEATRSLVLGVLD